MFTFLFNTNKNLFSQAIENSRKNGVEITNIIKDAIISECKSGTLENLIYLNEICSHNILKEIPEAYLQAIMNGKLDIVKYCQKVANTITICNIENSIKYAREQGHYDIVFHLMSHEFYRIRLFVSGIDSNVDLKRKDIKLMKYIRENISNFDCEIKKNETIQFTSKNKLLEIVIDANKYVVCEDEYLYDLYCSKCDFDVRRIIRFLNRNGFEDIKPLLKDNKPCFYIF